MSSTDVISRPGTARRRRPATHAHLRWTVLVLDTVGVFLLANLVVWARLGTLGGEVLASRRLLVLGLLAIGCQWLFDSHRCDPTVPWRRVLTRVLVADVCAGILIGLGIYALGPELLVAYGVLSRSIVPGTLVAFALWAILVRRLLRGWQRDRVGQACWLLVGQRGAEGLPAFWRDWVQHRGQGRLEFLADSLVEGAAQATAPEARPDDGAGARGSTSLPALQAGAIPVPVGTWNELEARLAEPWSGVVVADPQALPEPVVRALMHARLGGLPVMGIEEFCEEHWSRVPVEYLRGEWFAFAQGFSLVENPLTAHAKRVSDVLLALLGLLLAAPLFALVGLAVRLTSRGPVLFTQPRVGQGGEVFTCYKFRTMKVRAHGEEGSIYTAKADPRLTPVGGLLRKTRLDEIPQLWNVLRGDMSFIGPRAEWTECVANYEGVIPYYQLRHLVRPGLTGWAQVNYPYGAGVDDARIKLTYDLWYIKNHSLWTDLLILARTVRVVMFGIGGR